MSSATVVVPVKDGARDLPALLAALAAQAGPARLEVVALDSGSRDASRRLLEQAGARVIAVERFDHGETRNLGVREARGDYVLFLSQDAAPTRPDYVARLIETLSGDPRLAGAFARQVPRSGADPLTRRDLMSGVAAGPEPRRVFLSEAEYASLDPGERHRLSVFDNVASAAPRRLLLDHPFGASRFGEDLEWGQRMLRAGWGLAYVPQAVVAHSHARRARALFRRNYLGHRLLWRLFGLATVPDRWHLLRAGALSLAGDLRTLAREGAAPGLWLAAPLQALAAVYGQYRGVRDELRGAPYPRWS